jgi:hypothetical protein
MTDVRITDKIGVVGLDATDYPEEQTERVTSLNTKYLLQGLEILETLGWSQVDVCLVEPYDDDEADNPALVLRPPTDSFFGGKQAGIAITPVTDKGRRVNDD